jgi:hypothetical protein
MFYLELLPVLIGMAFCGWVCFGFLFVLYPITFHCLLRCGAVKRERLAKEEVDASVKCLLGQVLDAAIAMGSLSF